MQFIVLGVQEYPAPDQPRDMVYLSMDNWNDYFDSQTQYYVRYRDSDGQTHDIGRVKIGQIRWDKTAQRRPTIPLRFAELGAEFFSLGQDDEYYQRLIDLTGGQSDPILRAMRDIAFDTAIFEAVWQEEVTRTSLLRDVSVSAVFGYLNRISHGQVPLTPYAFTYQASSVAQAEPLRLGFEVIPHSNPPTNLHVLIGRNGAGKTRLLNGMATALADPFTSEPHVGAFTVGSTEAAVSRTDFANVVSVTFSAFDRFKPLDEAANLTSDVKYFYVGLKRPRNEVDHDGLPLGPRDERALAIDFKAALERCLEGPRRERWRTAVATLEADPNFHDAGMLELIDSNSNDMIEAAVALFERMSSGHSIVLLTITKLVEKVEEKTLVLLDEPEAHLHPPLLSAFVRALSDLIIDRNGVAIVATHSPVVLQEVPRSCVWKIERWGLVSTATRPTLETFGENVGTLTREVFGLEITNSGFNRLMRIQAAKSSSYYEASATFNDQLGSEAMGLLRTYLASEREEDAQQ